MTAFVAQSLQCLGYGLDDQSSIPRRGKEGIFSLCHHIQTGSGAHLVSYPLDTVTIFSGIRRPGSEVDISHLSIADVNAWRYTSTPPYVFMAWCLVKHRDNFIFTLISDNRDQKIRHIYTKFRHWAWFWLIFISHSLNPPPHIHLRVILPSSSQSSCWPFSNRLPHQYSEFISCVTDPVHI
jgi:hypothetical protein